MCGRFYLQDLTGALRELFAQEEGAADLGQIPSQPPRYNIAPSQSVPVLRLHPREGKREVALLCWGFLPGWLKTPGARAMINARAETLAEKPFFRAAFAARRCLIPAHGYYEWRKEGGGKQPYLIRFPNGAPFAMAGLWERREEPGGTPSETCAIITTEALAAISHIHHRMPLILSPSQFQSWLQPAATQVHQDLLFSHPHIQGLQGQKVGQVVNSPRNDHPGCIAPSD